MLVTGGAGFIGSHLVDRLLGDGTDVTVMDDLSTGAERNLTAAAQAPNFRFVNGSILDGGLVDGLVADVQLVFHLAAAVGVRRIIEDPLASMATNVNGTEHVLASAHRYGARVLLASTSEIYGRSRQLPFREAGERLLGATSIHRWSYATAKALDEHLAFAYAERGLKVSIVRYFNSYGPRVDQNGYGSVVARFIWQALNGLPITVHGDGKQSRCFTYVSDTVDWTVRAATNDNALNGVFNLGNPHEVTILDLAIEVRRLAGSSSEIRFEPYDSAYPSGFEDPPRRVPDVTRAQTLLGFEPRVDLAEGLMRTLEWCRRNYEVTVKS